MHSLPWHNRFPRTVEEISNIITEDLPELAPATARALGEGWDYCTYLVNETWVFRFPKRYQSARGLLRELRHLNALGPDLADTLPIPRYSHHVQRSKAYPTAYAAYPFLKGEALFRAPADNVQRVGEALGAFLGRLHRLAPQPPQRMRDELLDWIPDFRRELKDAAGGIPPPIRIACERLLDRPPPAFRGVPRFTHADLGAEHILVNPETLQITGIIDWGDAAWGDPLADYVGLWAWGGDLAAHAGFQASGFEVSADHWARVRFWGACYAIGSAYYGYKDGHGELHRAALSWLDRMHANRQLEDPANSDA